MPASKTRRGLFARMCVAVLGIAVSAVLLTASASAAPGSTASTPLQVLMPYGNFFQPAVDLAIQLCQKNAGPATSIPDPSDYTQLNVKILVGARAGRPVDLAVQGLNTAISMGENKFAVDLSRFTKGNRVFSPKVMPGLSAGKVGGRLVTIPWGISMPVIFVNENLFSNAGVNPFLPIKTWADLETMANRLTDAKNGIYGLALANQEGWIPLNFLLNGGTNLVGSNGKPTFNNAQGKAVITFLNRLYHEGAAYNADETQRRQAFAQGKVAMFIGSTGNFSFFQQNTFPWTTLPFPRQTAGAPLKMAAGGAGISMFATGARQKAAWKLVKCLFDPRVLKIVVEKFGYMPVRTDIASFLKPGLVTSSPYAAGFYEFRYTVPWYAFPGPNAPQASSIFNDAWEKAATASDQPTAVLDAAASDISRLLPSKK